MFVHTTNRIDVILSSKLFNHLFGLPLKYFESLNIEGIGAAYLTEIQIDDMPKDIKVGMEGECNIIIGTRTVLDYFLEPFKEGFRESLKEK